METVFDLYEDTALVYTRLIRQENQEAAGAIELIHSAFGSHAALRAALIITIMKIEVQQNHWIPNIGLYAALLEDYPDALPLTKYAMTGCLHTWAVPVVEATEWVELPITRSQAKPQYNRVILGDRKPGLPGE